VISRDEDIPGYPGILPHYDAPENRDPAEKPRSRGARIFVARRRGNGRVAVRHVCRDAGLCLAISRDKTGGGCFEEGAFVKGEALTPDSNPGPLAHQRRALPLGYSHQSPINHQSPEEERAFSELFRCNDRVLQGQKGKSMEPHICKRPWYLGYTSNVFSSRVGVFFTIPILSQSF
jgi:hypothetical protein